jgi:peptidoglycan/LPS O-acetylase OafA/YrhL
MLLALLIQWEPGDRWIRGNIRHVYGLLTILTVTNIVQLPWIVSVSPEFGLIAHITLTLFFSCLVLVLIYDQKGKLAALFRWKPLCKIGQLSYCIYLTHFGINVACHYLIRRSYPEILDWKGQLTTALAMAMTFSVAALSWKYFERPLIRRGYRHQY